MAGSNYFNGTGLAGRVNIIPGYEQNLYLAPLSWFDTMGVPAGGGGADNATISTDHTFLTGDNDGFIQVYALADTPTAPSESVGDAGALVNSYKLAFFLPSDGVLDQVMMDALMNDDLIAIAVDPSTGEMKQFGSQALPLHITKKSLSTGTTKPDGKKGWDIETETIVRYTYSGTLTVMS